jgi:hypothetical protein
MGMRIIGCVLVALLLGACDDACTQGAERCRGDRVELCSSGGEWKLYADCGEVEGGDSPWACCETDAGVNCAPAAECAGGDQ